MLVKKRGREMHFTIIFGLISVIYSMFWYQQALPPPGHVFTAIMAGATVDILLLLRKNLVNNNNKQSGS